MTRDDWANSFMDCITGAMAAVAVGINGAPPWAIVLGFSIGVIWSAADDCRKALMKGKRP